MWTSWSSTEVDPLKVPESRNPLDTWHGLFWTEPRGDKFHCQVCLEFFPTRLSLSTHIKFHQRPTCFKCWIVFGVAEELDDHNVYWHAEQLNVPQNSPEMSLELSEMEDEEEESQDSGIIQTPADEEGPAPETDLSFAQADTSTPKGKTGKRQSLGRASDASGSLTKQIVTRSGRKINFKPKDD